MNNNSFEYHFARAAGGLPSWHPQAPHYSNAKNPAPQRQPKPILNVAQKALNQRPPVAASSRPIQFAANEQPRPRPPSRGAGAGNPPGGAPLPRGDTPELELNVLQNPNPALRQAPPPPVPGMQNPPASAANVNRSIKSERNGCC